MYVKLFLENSFPLNGVYVLDKFENYCSSRWMENELEGCTCGYEMKRHLLLGRKAMTNLDSILKSRDITLPTKIHLVKAMVFPVVMYGCELDYKESSVPKN